MDQVKEKSMSDGCLRCISTRELYCGSLYRDHQAIRQGRDMWRMMIRWTKGVYIHFSLHKSHFPISFFVYFLCYLSSFYYLFPISNTITPTTLTILHHPLSHHLSHHLHRVLMDTMKIQTKTLIHP